MAVAIVDAQKPVEIDEGKGNLFRPAGMGCDLRIVGMESRAVCKPGQNIP